MKGEVSTVGSTMAERQVRRFYDEIWNRPDVSLAPEVLAPDVTFRGSLGPTKVGHDEFIEYVRYVTGALAGYRCDIESLVIEGDRAAARMMFSGVHRATFLDVPATGRRVAWAGDLHSLHAQLAIRD